MKEKMGILLFLLLGLLLGLNTAIAQDFELNSRLYKEEKGKWYIYHEGKKCDRIESRRLIIRKKSKTKPTQQDFENLDISRIKIKNRRYIGGYYVLYISDEVNPFQIAKKINQDPNFDYVAFDSYVSFKSEPHDVYYDSFQWNLKSNHLDLKRAWDITTGNSSIILAFIDSGFDKNHEDLDGNLWINSDETAGDSIDNDNNGYVDDLHGWRFGGANWLNGGLGDNDVSKNN